MSGMLEWVCPKCNRDVDPSLTHCPFCGFEEGKAPAAPTSAPAAPAPPAAVARPGRRLVRRRKRDWSALWGDVERGFRFGLGFVAALAVAYFVLYLISYYGGYPEWADRLARWLRLR